jgi:hypothetical protein
MLDPVENYQALFRARTRPGSRVVGFVRDDKSAEDTTTTKEIAEMFAQQRRSRSRPK